MTQSWGRTTSVVRRTDSGSLSASQRSLATVKAASGTDPTASAHAALPPSSLTRSWAVPAERVSFHSRAGRTTAPDSSRVTMPCC